MRRRLSALAILLPTLASPADLEPGTFEVTGTTRFSFTSQTVSAPGAADTTSKSTQLELAGLYYPWRNVGLGLFASFQDQSTSVADLDIKARTWVVGPRLGLDLGVGRDVALFAAATIGWARAETDATTLDGWAWGVAGGVKYFLGRAASLDASLGWLQLALSDGGSDVDTSGFSVGAGLSVYFGGAR